MHKELENIKMGQSRLSYIASAHGVLTHAGFWKTDATQLAGFSGLAFQFIIHESVCPSSVTVYDWATTHFAAMDRIGIYTDCVSIVNQPGLNTYPELQADAIGKIRASIDRGIGVIVWAPTPILEFGIIKGYDDEDCVFFVTDCANENPDPLLYDNLGRSDVPYLYFQRFLSRKDVDPEKLHRDVLAFGLGEWEKDHPDRRYSCGARAYDTIISSLKKGTYDPFGTSYVINVYADAKKAIAAFLKSTDEKNILPGLKPAAQLYDKIASIFAGMAENVPFSGPGRTTIDQQKIPELVKDLTECKKLETTAMKEIRDLQAGFHD
jgi:hypothetical protein